MALFSELHDTGRTIVMVTHEHDIAAAASRIVQLHDGRVVDAGYPVGGAEAATGDT